jgi:hypothetical protein
MIFAHDQFVILDLFGESTIFSFFNNSEIVVLLLKSKQSKPLVQGLYGNINFVINSWINLSFKGLIVIF